MMNWNELTDQEQIYMYWNYVDSLDEDENISFQDFDAMMREDPWV